MLLIATFAVETVDEVAETLYGDKHSKRSTILAVESHRLLVQPPRNIPEADSTLRMVVKAPSNILKTILKNQPPQITKEITKISLVNLENDEKIFIKSGLLVVIIDANDENVAKYSHLLLNEACFSDTVERFSTAKDAAAFIDHLQSTDGSPAKADIIFCTIDLGDKEQAA